MRYALCALKNEEQQGAKIYLYIITYLEPQVILALHTLFLYFFNFI